MSTDLALLLFPPAISRQTINKRWTYNCVQNLLTAQLKPGLLLDGAVDRLVEPGKRAGDRLDDGEDDEEYDDDGSTRRGIRPRSHQGDTNDKSFNISSSTTLLGRDSPRPRSDDQSEFDHYDYDDGEADEAEADDEDDDDNGSSLTMSSRGDENDGGLDDSSSFAMSSKKGSKMAAGGYFTPAPAPKKTPKTPWTEGDIKLMVRLKDFDRLTHEEVAVSLVFSPVSILGMLHTPSSIRLTQANLLGLGLPLTSVPNWSRKRLCREQVRPGGQRGQVETLRRSLSQEIGPSW